MDCYNGLTDRDIVISRLDESGAATTAEMVGWINKKRPVALAVLGGMVSTGDIRRVDWQKGTGLALWALQTSP